MQDPKSRALPLGYAPARTSTNPQITCLFGTTSIAKLPKDVKTPLRFPPLPRFCASALPLKLKAAGYYRGHSPGPRGAHHPGVRITLACGALRPGPSASAAAPIYQPRAGPR